jgi:YgiT-type zinc finger domain-containing protein
MTKVKTCALCGGGLTNSTTTFTVDYGHGLFVARHVPAQVCNQCGESWIDDETSAHLEELLQQAKSRHAAFEVIDMAA